VSLGGKNKAGPSSSSYPQLRLESEQEPSQSVHKSFWLCAFEYDCVLQTPKPYCSSAPFRKMDTLLQLTILLRWCLGQSHDTEAICAIRDHLVWKDAILPLSGWYYPDQDKALADFDKLLSFFVWVRKNNVI
jgi:hypothetical protein